MKKNIFVFLITLFSFAKTHTAEEFEVPVPEPQAAVEESLSELQKQLPEGWRDAQGLLFVTHFYSARVSVLKVGNNGSLTPIQGSPFDTGGAAPVALALSNDGTHLFVSSSVSGNISVFTVGDNGSLTPIEDSPFSTGGESPGALTLSNDGTHLFVSSSVSGNISVFTVGDNGSLTPIEDSPFSTGGSYPRALTLSNDGTHLFVSNFRSDNISVFTVGDNGSLTPIEGSPFDTGGADPVTLALSNDGTRLFVINAFSNNISVFKVAGNGGLTPIQGSPFDAEGRAPLAITLSNDGTHLFVSSEYANNISVFKVAENGRLTSIQGSPFDTGWRAPLAITLSNDGTHLFATNFNDISIFTVADNGALTLVGSPFNGGERAGDIAFSPLPKRWREAQNVDTTRSLHKLFSKFKDQELKVKMEPKESGSKIVNVPNIESFPSDLDLLITQFVDGPDVRLTDEMRAALNNSRQVIVDRDLAALSLDQLIDQLAYHFDERRVSGGLFQGIASVFIDVARGKLTPEGFELLGEWIEVQDTSQLPVYLTKVRNNLDNPNLTKIKRIVLESVRDNLFYALRKDGN